MEISRTNWLAVLASAVAGTVLGFLWYGVLFLDKWAAGNGLRMDEAAHKMYKGDVELPQDMSPMLVNVVVLAIYAFLMDWLLRRQGVSTYQGGATTGAVIGLISLLGIFISNMYAFRPMSLSWVDGPYVLILFTVIGAIMGGWQKK